LFDGLIDERKCFATVAKLKRIRTGAFLDFEVVRSIAATAQITLSDEKLLAFMLAFFKIAQR